MKELEAKIDIIGRALYNLIKIVDSAGELRVIGDEFFGIRAELKQFIEVKPYPQKKPTIISKKVEMFECKVCGDRKLLTNINHVTKLIKNYDKIEEYLQCSNCGILFSLCKLKNWLVEK